MNQSEKMFVVKAATNKIGVTHAHNLLCSMKGGYEYVHGTTGDFKNHQRDANVFIGESDTQMLINKMENRKMYVPNFTFQYRVEKSELVAMFWADEVAKCNYKEFGDIVSFDATFNNNNDSTGISCDSTLISSDSSIIACDFSGIPLNLLRFHFESHVILLESQVILLESHVILLESHVILLLSQICKEIYDETNFKERFDKIVWNMFIEPLKFEEKWTASRSESENSFFKSFTSPGATLVSFMMSYESAMERQRYRQEALDFKTIEAAPKCETKLAIELHATKDDIFACSNGNKRRSRMIIDYFFTKKGKEQEKKTETVGETMRDYKIGIESHEISMESHVILWNLMRDFHGISCDSVESHEICIESHEISMRLQLNLMTTPD
ncbi:regulation of nuclear pre-mRNA domain-containing protein 1B [Tanacetum coccineum]